MTADRPALEAAQRTALAIAEVEDLLAGKKSRLIDVWSEDLRALLSAAKEEERLRRALQRVDGINDNPAGFNADIDAVVSAALLPAGEKPCKHEYEAEDDKGWRCKLCGHQT